MCMLSIVIPNYNNAKYLNRCLDSILSARTADFEVIVIDDGSTDNSVECLESYKDKRLIFYTQENQGVSAARNKGLSYAKGEYVTFCDADDFYIDNAIDELIKIIKRENEEPDIFIFNAFQETVDVDGHRKRRIWPNAVCERIEAAAPQSIDCGIYMGFVVQNSNMNSAVNKVYKHSLLTAEGIKFPVGLGIGEDGIFNLKCAASCSKVVYIPREYYVYCYGESAFTSGKLRGGTGRLDETLKGFSEREKIINAYCAKCKVSKERVKKYERYHEDYMIEQLYHQIEGVKRNVVAEDFKTYVKGNSRLVDISKRLLLRGTSMKRKIQSVMIIMMKYI